VTGRERIFVALDTQDAAKALDLAGTLRGHVGGFKVGLELFSAAGPPVVEALVASGADVFLDLKLHDIPNTAAGAAAAAGRLNVRFFTVHALGGIEMIRRALESSAQAADKAELRRPTLLAVTILTSHSEGDLARIGIEGKPLPAVTRLAELAREAGAKGAVCSPFEATAVRTIFPVGTLMVPGIRPAEAQVRADDQSRTATPGQAVELGADFLVVGRPITGAADPAAAAAGIAAELDALEAAG